MISGSARSPLRVKDCSIALRLITPQRRKEAGEIYNAIKKWRTAQCMGNGAYYDTMKKRQRPTNALIFLPKVLSYALKKLQWQEN